VPTTALTTVQPGALVRARGRDWVVLPSQEAEVVRLRPLTGSDEDAVGLFVPLEGRFLQPSAFPLPNPEQAGDVAGGLLLSDASRLRLRDGAAPFRSLGHIAVTPRPYQFVPLIMALRLDPVRLLIADDVGVGKTIEAGLIARELLDRGIARRMAVLCPAHLCDQWESELRDKFGIAAAVVQPSRIGRLESDMPRRDQSIYQYYRHLVVSIDFIKSARNRGFFLQNVPDLIIVDEAHTAARPRGDPGRGEQQRYDLLRELASRPASNGRLRHLLLVTATPHSGIEESFRSLLGLLDARFDLNGASPATLDRKALLPHVVQRRRADLEHWLGAETPFPSRDAQERTYVLSAAYERLFRQVLEFCREAVGSGSGVRRHHQRVRHWAAIAMLRCLLSSPAAAVAVLGGRVRRGEGSEQVELPDGGDADAVYRPQVLDPLDEENVGDYTPTAPVEDAEPHLNASERRRLTSFLGHANDLAGPENDAKLQAAAGEVRELLRDGFHPIVFCRFIATANYLETWLPGLLSGVAGLQVSAVTGELGDDERREKVAELAREPRRVLVATDCLSEGINLQEHFDAVLHYDLPWNPNRLEQREGRVDRFGQPRDVVKTIILSGSNNEVDQVVLDVLVRKARAIRNQLGVSVPVPAQSEQVMEAVVENVLLRGGEGVQLRLQLDSPQVSQLHQAWDVAAEQEQRQRAYFRQEGIQPAEVQKELEATDPVLGNAAAVRTFLADALQRFDGGLRPVKPAGVYELQPGTLAGRLSATVKAHFQWRVCFEQVSGDSARHLGRAHPLVAAVCDAVLGQALDVSSTHASGGERVFARCGAIYTSAVALRTAVALLRLRYLLKEQGETFAEEVVLAAFQRRDGKLLWLDPPEGAGRELLSRARPVANMAREERAANVAWALEFLRSQPDSFAPVVAARVRQLQESHARLRRLVKASRLEVAPRLPPDILGLYVLVPSGGANGAPSSGSSSLSGRSQDEV